MFFMVLEMIVAGKQRKELKGEKEYSKSSPMPLSVGCEGREDGQKSIEILILGRVLEALPSFRAFCEPMKMTSIITLGITAYSIVTYNIVTFSVFSYGL